MSALVLGNGSASKAGLLAKLAGEVLACEIRHKDVDISNERTVLIA
jgi:hypothetical protein